MSGKPKDYLWAFIIGGLFGVLAEGLLALGAWLGIPYGLSITLTMAVIGLFGFFTTIPGLYEKWEAMGGMGGFLPFSGLVSVVVEQTGARLAAGDDLKRAALAGLKGPFLIFGVGVPFCMLLALIKHFLA